MCTPSCDTPEPSDTMLAMPNVVLEVCVWPPMAPKGDQAVLHHPWDVGHCLQCPMTALAAENGMHTIMRHTRTV